MLYVLTSNLGLYYTTYNDVGQNRIIHFLMLEQLFGSQTRVKLLQIFLNNSDSYYFVRELTRMLDSQINAVRRELENLLRLGIIVEVRPTVEGKSKKSKQKMRYYQAAPDFILYADLKNMIQKTQFVLEQEFARDLSKVGRLTYLALTGAFVGEKAVPVDLLIVGDISKVKFKKVIEKYQKKFNREINYTLLDAEEFNYRRNVADRFIYSILDGKKIVMVDEIFNTGLLS